MKRVYFVLVVVFVFFVTSVGAVNAAEYVRVATAGSGGNYLGFHIIGPYAPELIQEAVNAMASGGDVNELNEGIHIHPSLSELVPITVNSVVE